MNEKYNPLETHRVKISPDSLVKMKEAREMLLMLQEKYPEVRAMTFYGSRTLNRERDRSDLDNFILFDNGKRIDPEICNDRSITRDENKFLEKVKEKGIDLNLSTRWFSISKEYTDYNFKHFKEEPWKGDFGADNRFGRHDGMPEGHVSIIARFMPGVGDVYSARKAIFDLLEKEDPKYAEELFGILMERLQEIERPEYIKHRDVSDIPSYSYPETIADGKKYFLHKIKSKN